MLLKFERGAWGAGIGSGGAIAGCCSFLMATDRVKSRALAALATVSINGDS